MSSLCGGGQPDLLAVVGYLPEPLAGFVNRVRRELAPECHLRAHITLLPPRAISCPLPTISQEIEAALGQFRAFRVAVEDIRVFPISNVVYLSIGSGCQHIRQLHESLNQGRCLSPEVWCFEPHVTLAQNLDPGKVTLARDLAAERWRDYSAPRDFMLDNLTLVQGNIENGWSDLATFELTSPVLA